MFCYDGAPRQKGELHLLLAVRHSQKENPDQAVE